MNYFEELYSVNTNQHTEAKNGLTYLSWAWAWAEVKKRFPKSYYTIYENQQGWNYHTDGRTAWVKTGVTVVTEDGEIEHIEYLPVMDFRNKSIPLEQVTSFDVNKAIQRSLTKAVARHGLGLYIYAGEDLPEGESDKYASDTEKQNFVSACKAMNLEPTKILTKTGWKKGEKLTKEQLEKALIILKEISDGRNEANGTD